MSYLKWLASRLPKVKRKPKPIVVKPVKLPSDLADVVEMVHASISVSLIGGYNASIRNG